MNTLLDRILEANSQQEALDRFEERADELQEEAPDAVETLEDGLFDATAVLALPEKYHRWLRRTNMLERLILEPINRTLQPA
jgi:transposase-like protein